MFDYYANANVKAKHQKAYLNTKSILAQFEATDPRFNAQQLQKAWKEYCTKQAVNIDSFAATWATATLASMNAV